MECSFFDSLKRFWLVRTDSTAYHSSSFRTGQFWAGKAPHVLEARHFSTKYFDDNRMIILFKMMKSRCNERYQEKRKDPLAGDFNFQKPRAWPALTLASLLASAYNTVKKREECNTLTYCTYYVCIYQISLYRVLLSVLQCRFYCSSCSQRCTYKCTYTGVCICRRRMGGGRERKRPKKSITLSDVFPSKNTNHQT